MNKTLNYFLKAALVVALGSLVACGEEKPPAPQNQVVSKKIIATPSKAKPTAGTASTQKADAGTPESKPDKAVSQGGVVEQKPAVAPSQKGQAAPVEPAIAKTSGEAQTVTSDLVKASLEMVSNYSAKGRFDPFKPLFTDQPEESVVPSAIGKKKKRAPQTPLERVALSQLKLTAVLRMPQGNRALVEDATGKGYVVKKGTYMGLNAGQVIRIDADRVLIEEEIQNMVGEYIINNTELKLQKTAGDQ